MATALHTFTDIFNTEIEYQGEVIPLKKIVIPIIQRDYAQGREGADIARVRMRFLDSLYRAVTEAPVTLDFIYGDIDQSGIMTPLDGQQRLTTLFLLHWYAAKKAALEPSEYEFLKCFSYETRYSARDFCNLLISFEPSFAAKISEEIVDQPWFPLDWMKDQTVSSMLTMLDSIDEKFAVVPDLWERLCGNAISFYFLPIRDMGLTDELYIKMNSRGKPLTLFEHFKAELEHKIKAVDPDVAKRLMHKIDLTWTDMLWYYRGDDNVIDDEFLRYFRFICDILCYRSGGSPQGQSGDEFDLLEKYFSDTAESPLENMLLMEKMFDCWCDLDSTTPDAFLTQYFTHEHEAGKIKIDDRYAIDIFEDCLRTYSEIVGVRNRKFPLNRIVLLYAIVIYLINRDTITENQFIRRLRIVNNLVQNSEDEISDSENRSSGNRMPAILRQVDSIMVAGVIDISVEKNFNQFQLQEEQAKLDWCAGHPELEESLFKLEDHELLYGQISIVGLDHPDYFSRFESLLACDWDAVDCALLVAGNYGQTERNGWRHQLGSSFIDAAWRNLFHKSANRGYENTHDALIELLAQSESFTNEVLQNITQNYITECEVNSLFDWRYYYIKYPSFRLGRYGKYIWYEFKRKPYEMLAMWTEISWSSNTRQPFLFEIDKKNIDRDDNGRRLLYSDKYVSCENNAFVIFAVETGEEVARIDIQQTDNGIDTEDRILKGRKQLPTLLKKL